MKTGINDLLGRGRLMSGKETKSLRKRRRMEFPDTYIILIGLCLLAVILTIVLPAGQYDREERNGRTVVVAGGVCEGGGGDARQRWQVPFMR